MGGEYVTKDGIVCIKDLRHSPGATSNNLAATLAVPNADGGALDRVLWERKVSAPCIR